MAPNIIIRFEPRSKHYIVMLLGDWKPNGPSLAGTYKPASFLSQRHVSVHLLGAKWGKLKLTNICHSNSKNELTRSANARSHSVSKPWRVQTWYHFSYTPLWDAFNLKHQDEAAQMFNTVWKWALCQAKLWTQEALPQSKAQQEKCCKASSSKSPFNKEQNGEMYRNVVQLSAVTAMVLSHLIAPWDKSQRNTKKQKTNRIQQLFCPLPTLFLHWRHFSFALLVCLSASPT